MTDRFEAILRGESEPNRLTYDIVDPAAEPCEWAKALSAWFAEQVDRLSTAPDLVSLNQLLLLLQHKYFALRRVAPKTHQNHLSPRGHPCLYQTYVDAFERLEAMLLRIEPPQVVKLVRPTSPEVEAAPKSWLEEIEEGRST